MKLNTIIDGKICPLISSGLNIVKCSGLNCAMYDSALKTCRIIAMDDNLEIIARSISKLQK